MAGPEQMQDLCCRHACGLILLPEDSGTCLHVNKGSISTRELAREDSDHVGKPLATSLIFRYQAPGRPIFPEDFLHMPETLYVSG